MFGPLPRVHPSFRTCGAQVDCFGVSTTPPRIDVPTGLIDVPSTARRLYPYSGFSGVSVAELQVLVVLAADGDSTINAIGNRLELDPSRTSHTARTLRAKGLAVQRADGDD